MVYTLSQIHSKENEKLMREHNPDYEELRLYNERCSRDLFNLKTKQKTSEQVTCECGCVVVKSSLARHRMTPKHMKLLSSKNKKEITSKEYNII